MRRLTAALLLAALAGTASAAEGLFEPRTSRPTPAASAASSAASSTATRESLAELLLQIEALNAEVRQLRGLVEVQAHELELMKARDRDLSADFDRRLRELERRAAAAPGSAEAEIAGHGAAAAATIVTARPAGTAGSAISAEEQQAYDAAFRLMKQGQYEHAAKAFRDYIAKYPRGPLTDNAQYWLGEANYVVRNFKGALDEFNKVLTDFPGSPKAPDALLKIGYAHIELGNAAKGRDALSQVVARYPGTPAAKSAQERLAKLKTDKR
jgi:tol-pal system protein YbgF